MCIAFMCNKGRPPQGVLEQAERENSDGIGVAWPEGGKIFWEKGLDLEGLDLLLKKQKGPLAIHFRAASSGPKSPQMCHPFPINEGADLLLKGSAEKVLFHNGTWGEWRKALLQSAFSNGDKIPRYPNGDTRTIAWLLHRHGEGLLDALDLHDRFLILDSTKKEIFRMWGSWQDKGDYMQSSSLIEIKPKKEKKEKESGEDRYANYPFPKGGKTTHLLPVGSITPGMTDTSNAFSEVNLVAVLGELRASRKIQLTGTC